tara:strand:+ start:6549 stop:6665 length:117 start_codon:yes stop_codon:yes gene_type:complete
MSEKVEEGMRAKGLHLHLNTEINEITKTEGAARDISES